MKRITSKHAVLAIIMACVASPLSAQESLPIRNCTWCHGSSAQGYTSAPRLAGQTHRYIENSLLSFKSHARDNPASKQYMWGAAANLSKETARGFAVYFSELPASPANDGDEALASEGKSIYVEGRPASNVVSCSGGPRANAENFRRSPRFGGMRHNYLKRRLGR